jgi:hypothetical protein
MSAQAEDLKKIFSVKKNEFLKNLKWYLNILYLALSYFKIFKLKI